MRHRIFGNPDRITFYTIERAAHCEVESGWSTVATRNRVGVGLSRVCPVTALIVAGGNGALHAGVDLASVAEGEERRETLSSEFDTPVRCAYHYSGAEVAQLVEHSTENAGVVSSILTLGTASDGGRRAGVAQW